MEKADRAGKAPSGERSVLTEAEAKRLLDRYGVPVVRETVAEGAEDAVIKARAMGFPAVLKGLGVQLSHKTERGLVRLNLLSESEVRRAAQEIGKAAGSDLEGYLVQPMLTGRREFVAGLIRDAQFGPVVMFGLGGILTEALRDVAFRIAPFDEQEAHQMLEEIRAADLLGAFRGEAPADREAFVRSLVGLSRLGMDNPDVIEVDINPLLVGPDGAVTAVDALVVLDKKRTASAGVPKPSEDPKSFLDVMLAPKSIAVIGASRSKSQEESWMSLMGVIARFGYQGRLYPINPKADEIDGYKAYPDLGSLPEPADLVIVSVAAPRVPAALRDCVASGHRNVHIFAAGFKETGEEEGIRLQREIEEIAVGGGLRVIGPNCMGIYNPKARVATWEPAPAQSGPVAFVSQSGGHAGDFTVLASRFGILFSKAISYGNALTLDCTDFLPYLADDDDTKIICLYLEGVKDGGKLLRQVQQINRTKPVIVMKGGLTKSGARAVASHTGSLAGGEHIWEAFYRQSGAVKVATLEEMADVLQAFLHLGPPQGSQVCVIGTGGGIGVSAADAFGRAGLDMSPLAEETRAALRDFVPAAGNMIRNPVDAGVAFSDPKVLEKALRILSKDPGVDMIVVSLHLDWFFDIAQGKHIVNLARYLGGEGKNNASGKPLVVSWRCYRTDSGIEQTRQAVQQELINGGVPAYEGFTRTAFALSRMVQYFDDCYRKRGRGKAGKKTGSF
ncbi:MAG: acetate--CoA ligase family protein [Deltaproteobacteria bacterium]|nr:acetate--CoA ligase family protein [Deltaproteobacteria bacterium]